MNITDKLKTNDLVEKGWTRGLIKKFLPEPCLVVKNIRLKGVTNLYSVEKVEAAEKSPDFKSAQIKSLKQSAASKLNADKKRAETLLQAQTIPISVELVEISKLRNLAVNSYNDWNLGNSFEKRASIHDSPCFLDRITVNFIRHNLTSYDFLLIQQWGKFGKDYAINIIRERIFDLIAKQYPTLAYEAERQKLAKNNLLIGVF